MRGRPGLHPGGVARIATQQVLCPGPDLSIWSALPCRSEDGRIGELQPEMIVTVATGAGFRSHTGARASMPRVMPSIRRPG